MSILKKIISSLLLLAFVAAMTGCKPTKSKEKFTKTFINCFDTPISVIGYEESEEDFNAVFLRIQSMYERYHKLFDIYTVYDGVNNLAKLNETVNGEHPKLTVEKELFDMLKLASDMYALTAGEVNIAMGSVLSLWHRCRTEGVKDPKSARLPTTEELTEASAHIDMDSLILNEEELSVFISDPEMTLDVGAIAKGYATELIASKLEEEGISSYLINAGGNIRAIGAKPDGELWTLGVENPIEGSKDQFIEYVKITNEAFVTSGSYQRYFYVGSEKYHHIIDKETLYPADGYLSVSVLCPDSAVADALSTALFCMDVESGKKLLESMDGTYAMWVDEHGKKTYSSGFEKYVSK